MKSQAVLGLLLLAATLAAYSPALTNGFIWDDDHHLTENPLVTGPDGLRKIWTSPEAFYYPLVLTTFWGMNQIWGLAPYPYHLTNILLHAANALLLWGLLARFGLRGGFLAALIFALHPVQVESVAWVTELKNTLSGLFYLLALHAFLSFQRSKGNHPGDEGIDGRNETAWYGVALVLSTLALLSKPSTVMLPVILLAYLLWSEGRISLRPFLQTAPFFLLSLAASLWTIWEQKHHSMAQGAPWDETFLERLLNAPRIVLFYLGKLLWPHPLSFIYPKWTVDPGVWSSYLAPFACLVLVGILMRWRRSWGGPCLIALGYFAVTLFPVLGFFNIYFTVYSYVADHFQYLACIGPMALLAHGCARFWPGSGLGRFVGPVGVGILALVLGAKTWSQCPIYRNEETLWLDVIAKNPSASMAYNNLGIWLSKQGRPREAIPNFERALELTPEDPEYHYNLALALGRQAEVARSVEHFEKAIAARPGEARFHNSYASLLAAVGRIEEAVGQYERSLEVAPLAPDAATNREALADLLVRAGRAKEALVQLREAGKIKPGDPALHSRIAQLESALGLASTPSP
ncbi:MAG: tetratricopeptide repeat protein [Candidatus Omnitrophica bacterium]|nr:hypothetical protein [bacterium]NUN98447.1 tetratricopeptide repeat protein [Candidatus Omnitrophota bacterium]